MKLTANVVGATGLVGKQLVDSLLENTKFEKVRIFVRRNSDIQHPKLEEHIVDFGDKKTWKEKLKGDVLFSTLGTTLKQAGSKERQYDIDFTLNYNFAKTAYENGIENYVLVSSIGANAKSRIFYTQIKGELDEAVAKLGFKNLAILRPSSLTGDRKERRTAEIITIPIATFLTNFVFTNYRPIKDKTVAKAMINTVLTPSKNKTIWEGKEVFNLSEQK